MVRVSKGCLNEVIIISLQEVIKRPLKGNIEEEEVYLQIQKALKPMRIQTTIIYRYTYMVMAGTVMICIK